MKVPGESRADRLYDIADRFGVGPVARSMLGMSAARVAGLAIGFVSSVLVARGLGPAGRGTLAVSMSIVAIGVQVGCVGLPWTNTYVAARDPSRVPALLRRTLQLAAAVAATAMIVGAAAHLTSTAPLRPGLMALTVAAIPFGVAFLCLQYLMLGMGRVGLFWQMDLVQRAGYLLLVTTGLLVVRRLAVSWVLGFSLASFALVVAWVVSVARPIDVAVAAGERSEAPPVGDAIGYAVRMYIATAFVYLVMKADVLIADVLLPAADVGNYAAAVTLVEPVLVIPTAVGTVLFRHVAAESSEAGRWRLFVRSVRWTAALALGIGLFLVVAAPVLVRLVYGVRFEGAVGPLQVLAIGVVPFAISTVAWNYLSAVGMPRWTVFAWGAASVLNIGLNLLLIDDHGIVAAAWTSLGTNSVLTVWLGLGSRLMKAGGSTSTAARLSRSGLP